MYVGFVRADSWIEERPSAVPDTVMRLLDHRWLRNGVALAVSLVIDAGLIMALVSLGRVELPSSHRVEQSITTFDIASVSAQAEGAASAPVAPTTAAPSSQSDSTPLPPQHVEWSMTTLPPAVLAPPAPAATVAAPAQGLSASGTGSGAGYDPYAFASYQKPDPARLGAAQALQPLPDAMARLIAALGASSTGRQIGVRAYVDPAGRVIRAELLASAPADLARRLASIAPGFQLCAADAARPSNASLVVTLTI
jgi:hypothetical protein